MNERFRLSRAFFRVVRRLYPKHIRDRYGSELEAFFLGTLATEKARLGWLGVPYVWLGLVLDITLRRSDDPTQSRVRSPGSVKRLAHEVRTDLSYATRLLRRSPAFAFLIAGTLTVGLATNVAIFSVVNGVLLQPLPYADPDELVMVWSTNAALGLSKEGPSPGDVLDWETLNETMAGLAAWYMTSGTYQEDDYAEELRTAQVTADFFDVLGVEAAVGKAFSRADVVDDFGPVVLSHSFWQRRFNGDSSVVGQFITSSGNRYQVIGIMPADFAFPDKTVEKWTGWDFRRGYDHLDAVPRTWRFLNVIGRLKKGTDLNTSKQEFNQIAQGLGEAFPDSNRGWQVDMIPLFDEAVGDTRAGLLSGLGAVGLLLLLACVNVANMLLARLPARSRELAVRAALGATRLRLVRQLVVEVGLLALVGTVGGVFVGYWLLRLLVLFGAEQIPRLDSVPLDGTVFAFALGLLLIVVLLCSVAPAIQLGNHSRLAEVSSQRAGARRQTRWLHNTLVSGQLGLATILLVGATLFAQSFRMLWQSDLGFETSNILSFRVSLNPRSNETGYIQRYYDAVLDSMHTIPGVTAAGASTTLPLDPVGNDFNRPFRLPGEQTSPSESAKGQMRIVTPGYFTTLGLVFESGRTFSGFERVDQPRVVIVNQTLARRLWRNSSAMGNQLMIDFRDGWQAYTVVGVVNDVRHYGARGAIESEIFLPLSQIPYLAMSVVIKTTAKAAQLAPAVRHKLAEIDNRQPAHHFNTMAELRVDTVAEERLLLLIFSMFGVVAIALAATGVYGVMSNAVSQRRREMGVRLVLGAKPSELATAVIVHAMWLAITGLIIGLWASWQMGKAIERLLFGITPTNTLVLGVAGTLLLTVAVTAAVVPARRTTRIDPALSLRSS